MRITIDATSLLLPSAGVKNYVYYAGLQGDSVSTYPPRIKLDRPVDHLGPVMGPRGTRFRLNLGGLSNLRGSPLLEILLAGTDVFHCSQHTVRTPGKVKTTATVFDFSCWTTPQYHTDANIAATKHYAESILKNCLGLIAISEHARRDAIDILGLPRERVRVIYPGVADVFFNVADDDVARLRQKYGIHTPYILFVGCIEPRKNVSCLIRAFMMLPASLRREIPLIIAGPFGWKSDEMRHLLATEPIRYLGYVPEIDLPALFRGASVVAYPSYYEGFGFPVAQAMAVGVPVVTSNRSCLPEVLGGGGLVVDPDSPEELASAIERIVTCADLARGLATQGKSRAGALYRWSLSANKSLEMFHRVFLE